MKAFLPGVGGNGTKVYENGVLLKTLNADTLAKISGIYDNFISGLAKNLLSKVSQQNVDAYLYRTSGGSLEIGDTCKEKAVIGGSLGWNQLIKNGNFADTSDWLIIGNPSTGTLTASGNILTWTKGNGGTGIIQSSFSKTLGHRYLVRAYVKPSVNAAGGLLMTGGGTNDYFANSRLMTANVWNAFAGIITATATGTGSFYVYGDINGTQEEGYTCQFENVMVTDLNADFGSTIANYVYNLETTTAGAGVAWFRRYFQKPYYPFTPIGGFTHVKTSGKKVVGFNLFNKNANQYTTFGTATIDGTKITVTGTYYCGIDIDLLPAQYYVRFDVLSSSTARIRFEYDDNTITDYKYSSGLITLTQHAKRIYLYCSNGQTGTIVYDKVNVNFHHDGERDGEYEEYEEETYPCDPIDLIGIPYIDEQGNLYFEGNHYNSDGTVDETHYRYVFTGNETWNYFEDGAASFWYMPVGSLPIPASSSVVHTGNGIAMRYQSSFRVYLRDNQNITSETSMNMIFHAGVEMVYTKAIATQSTATSFTEIQRVWNWGTEQYLPSENDTRPVEVPVGHDTYYLLDIRSKVEIMPDLPATMDSMW